MKARTTPRPAPLLLALSANVFAAEPPFAATPATASRDKALSPRSYAT